MRSRIAPPDLGLADVDFGPGPFTMVGLCQLDPRELIPAANAEAVGLWHELAAFCLARAATHAAALTDQHGGPSDPVAAFEAERAAGLAAARAEPDPAARARAVALASSSDGRDPARGFPEWEKDVLGARLGVSVGQAKRLCRTAVALRDRLPATASALAAGAISWAHADRLAEHTRELDPAQSGEVERRVLADGRAVTPRQHENRTRKLASAYQPAPGPAEPDSAPRPSLVASQNVWGGVEPHAQLTDEGGRIVATALDALSGRAGPADGRHADERRADALVELCQGFLDAGLPATASGARPHLTLTTTGDVLAGISSMTVALAGAAGLPPVEIDAEAARRIGCDAATTTLAHDHGQLLDGEIGLGRETRFPTARLRRRIEARDGGCRFPGCTRPAPRCHAHHVVHWAPVARHPRRTCCRYATGIIGPSTTVTGPSPSTVARPPGPTPTAAPTTPARRWPNRHPGTEMRRSSNRTGRPDGYRRPRQPQDPLCHSRFRTPPISTRATNHRSDPTPSHIVCRVPAALIAGWRQGQGNELTW